MDGAAEPLMRPIHLTCKNAQEDEIGRDERPFLVADIRRVGGGWKGCLTSLHSTTLNVKSLTGSNEDQAFDLKKSAC